MVLISENQIHFEERGIIRVTGGSFTSNCYIVPIGRGNECFLIDPGLDSELIENVLLQSGLRPSCVFCTHGHFDHIGSSSFFQKKYSTEVFLARADLKLAKMANFLMMAFKIPERIELPKFTLIDPIGFVYDIGGKVLRYWAVPGHSLGSCIIDYDNSLFSGDSLYEYGVGLSKVPGENEVLLRKSLLWILPRLSPSSRVYPGHGAGAVLNEILKTNIPLIKFLGDQFSLRGDEL
jgi:glyoxylase-like metal-dependent hydrolase (beta-lactamase superfamily II)